MVENKGSYTFLYAHTYSIYTLTIIMCHTHTPYELTPVLSHSHTHSRTHIHSHSHTKIHTHSRTHHVLAHTHNMFTLPIHTYSHTQTLSHLYTLPHASTHTLLRYRGLCRTLPLPSKTWSTCQHQPNRKIHAHQHVHQMLLPEKNLKSWRPLSDCTTFAKNSLSVVSRLIRR